MVRLRCLEEDAGEVGPVSAPVPGGELGASGEGVVAAGRGAEAVEVLEWQA